MKKSYIFILVLIIIIAIGCSNQNSVPIIQKKEVKETVSFKEQFPYVAADHRFVETDIYKVNGIFSKEKTAIIFVGFPKCPLCQQITPVLDEVAKANNIKEVLYFNALEERVDNTKAYKTFIKNIEVNLGYDEYGKLKLVMPLTLFVENGIIVGAYQGSALNAPVNSDKLDENLALTLTNTFDLYAKKISVQELLK